MGYGRGNRTEQNSSGQWSVSGHCPMVSVRARALPTDTPIHVLVFRVHSVLQTQSPARSSLIPRLHDRANIELARPANI